MRWKSWIAWLLLVGALAALGYGIYAYPEWRQARLVSLARQSMEKGDWRAAGLSLREATSLAPPNAELFRVLAEFDYRRRLPSAVRWRYEVLKLEPDSVPDMYALAATALGLGQPVIAEKALEEVPPDQRDERQDLEMRSTIALMRGNLDQGRVLLRQIADTYGEDDRLTLNLAKLDLLSSNPARRGQGLAGVRALAAHPELGAEALRSLVKYHLDKGDLTAAGREVEQLLQHKKMVAADMLLRLKVHRLRQPDTFRDEMRRQLQASGKDIPSVHFYLNWLMQERALEDLLALEDSLAPEARESVPVMVLLGQALVEQDRWAEFERKFAAADWKELDFLRLLYLARARDRAGAGRSRVDALWDRSVAAVGEEYGSMELVANTAAAWGWDERAEPLWLELSASGRNPLAAMHQLARRYRSQRKSGQLFRLYREALVQAPDNLAIRNNYASLCLLLGKDTEAARTIVQQLYKSHPQVPAVAATYASWRLTRGEAAEALDVLRKIPDDARRQPDIALTEARALAATGQNAAARTVLQTIDPGALLLEEEAQWRQLERETRGVGETP